MNETAVLISIKPKWVNLILSGKKTIEVRKYPPKLEPPFTCYIYETGTGQVVGEFVCDKTEYYLNHWGDFCGSKDIPEKSCLTIQELFEYAGEICVAFAWRISSVMEYDEPIPLSAFQIACTQKTPCNECQLWNNGRYQISGCALANIEKPPRSWRYVQKLRSTDKAWNDEKNNAETVRAMDEAFKIIHADISRVQAGAWRVDVSLRQTPDGKAEMRILGVLAETEGKT